MIHSNQRNLLGRIFYFQGSLTLIMTLVCCFVFAQQKFELKGTVLDEEGLSLEGVTISSTAENTVLGKTDNRGVFSISVSKNQSITFSLLGYSKHDVAIQNQSSLRIVLQVTSTQLEDVVVVGFGTSKKANLTGSVSSVKGDDLAKRQVGQSSMALQGLVPGLTVRQTSGQPGVDGGAMRIRGVGTLNNSDPLVLVDGVVMSLDNVDVSSIESISVLKDASSSSIYGSRAANGVILVTTKRGREGQISLSYDGYLGKQSPTSLIKLVNGLDHMNLINEAHTNVGRSPLFSAEYIEKYKEGGK